MKHLCNLEVILTFHLNCQLWQSCMSLNMFLCIFRVFAARKVIYQYNFFSKDCNVAQHQGATVMLHAFFIVSIIPFQLSSSLESIFNKG